MSPLALAAVSAGPAPASADGPAPDFAGGPTLGNTLAASAARGVLLQGGAFGVRAAASFVIQIALARLVEPASYGLFALAIAVMDVAGGLANLQLGSFHVQRQDSDAESRLPRLMLLQLAASAAIIAAGEIAMAPLFSALGWSASAEPFRWLLFLALILPQSAILRSALERRLEYGRAILPGLLALPVHAAVAVPMAMAGKGALALAVGQLAREAAELLILAALAAPRIGWGWKRAPLAPALRFAWPLVLSSALVGLYWHLDDAMVAVILGAGPLGLYHVAFRIPHHLLALNAPLVNTSLSVFSRLEGDGLQTAFEGFVRLSAYVHFAAGAIGAVLARPFVELALGPRWLDAVLPMQILFLLAAFRGPLTFWTSLHQSRGWSIFHLPASLLTCGLILAAGPPLARVLGIAGVAMAVAGAAGFSLIFLVPRYVRMALPGVSLPRVFAPCAALAACAAGLAAWARELNLVTSIPALLAVGAGILALHLPAALIIERKRLVTLWRLSARFRK